MDIVKIQIEPCELNRREESHLIWLLSEGILEPSDILNAITRIRERYTRTLARVRPYVEHAVEADGGINECRWTFRNDLSEIDDVLTGIK